MSIESDRGGESGSGNDGLRRVLGLVRAEYEHTRNYVDRVAGTAQQARTFGLTAIGALLTLAVQQRSAPLALLAIPLTYLFALVDGYQSFQYHNGAKRLREIELIRQAEIASAVRGRALDPRSLRRRINRMASAPYREELRGFGRNELRFLPRPIFRRLYPIVAVGAGSIAVLLQLAHDGAGQVVVVLFVASVAVGTVLQRLRILEMPFLAGMLRGVGVTPATVCGTVLLSLLFVAVGAAPAD